MERALVVVGLKEFCYMVKMLINNDMLNKGTFEGGRVHITDKQTVQIYTQGLYKIVLRVS